MFNSIVLDYTFIITVIMFQAIEVETIDFGILSDKVRIIQPVPQCISNAIAFSLI